MTAVQRAETTEGFEAPLAALDGLRANVESVVRGKTQQIKLVLSALACEGHVLVEDVPGTAKTVLARAIAGSIGGVTMSRVQCTPDLQPTDVTGLSIWNPELRRFEFQAGPVFANVVLVDEINRALPKAQSALLEAMAERQVTVDGTSHMLPSPFLLLATENTIEQEGTFPLPEAQLDRFLVRTSLGYPTAEEELAIVDAQLHGHPLEALRPVVDVGSLAGVFEAVENVYIDALLKRWAIDLVRATRTLEMVDIGASVRGSLALERVARAWALVNGREYVVAEDIETLFWPVVGHRLVLATDVLMDETRDDTTISAEVLASALARAPRPEPDWEAEPASDRP